MIYIKREKIIAVYFIRNKKNNIFYVGHSVDVYERFKKHKYYLKKKNHHCLYLQRAWDKYGEENFDFIIYKRFETEEESIALEQYIIDNYKKYLYNVSNYAKGGGDLISNNPNKEMIISKRTKTQLKNMSKMTKEERAEKYGLKGSLNGLYGKSRTPEFKKKLSEIKKGQIPYNKNKKIRRNCW